ncbi:Relaxosome protein [Citrobacter koseri]|uniref:Relaxosome protein n=1 Tax=Citrobacter koseri TaxID=545 RepID=A0A2X2X7U5_CITKO|nr:Relaxosome protein [Citrobacter koseri]
MKKAQIQENAEASGLSVASFIRKVAMGYQVESIVDIDQVVELSRVNADLGRLGGLLKLWLANDPRTVDFSPSLIKTLLAKIESTRQELRNIMDRILDKINLWLPKYLYLLKVRVFNINNQLKLRWANEVNAPSIYITERDFSS